MLAAVVARMAGRVPDARPLDRQLLLVFAAVLVANGAVSYAYAADDPGVALIEQLRRDALEMRGPNPDLVEPGAARWWGE